MHFANRKVGPDRPLTFIIGPCAIESYDIAMKVGEVVAKLSSEGNNIFIYKSSFDKANRTSAKSFRSIGFDSALRILSDVKQEFGLPVLTDVHLPSQVNLVHETVDCLQVPAFLCRQTDLVEACAASGKPVNIKKAQFLAPSEITFVVDKARSAAASKGHPMDNVMICERGSCFGYNDLIVDMRALHFMKETGCPIIFDASHSAQSGRQLNEEVGGDWSLTPVLARAAVAVGVSGIFIETHPTPETALSDGSTQYPLERLRDLIKRLIEIDHLVKSGLEGGV